LTWLEGLPDTPLQIVGRIARLNGHPSSAGWRMAETSGHSCQPQVEMSGSLFARGEPAFAPAAVLM